MIVFKYLGREVHVLGLSFRCFQASRVADLIVAVVDESVEAVGLISAVAVETVVAVDLTAEVAD